MVVVGVAIAAVGNRQAGGSSSSAATLPPCHPATLPPCHRANAQVEEYNTLCELAFQCMPNPNPNPNPNPTRWRSTTLCASSPFNACASSAASRCWSSAAASLATGERGSKYSSQFTTQQVRCRCLTHSRCPLTNHRPNAPRCVCQCACFCSDACRFNP